MTANTKLTSSPQHKNDENTMEQVEPTSITESTSPEEAAMHLNGIALNALWEGDEQQAVQGLHWTASQVYKKLPNFSAPQLQTTTKRRTLMATICALDLTDVLKEDASSRDLNRDGFLFYPHVFTVQPEYEDDDDSSMEEGPVMIQDEDQHLELGTRVVGTSWELTTLYALILYNMGVIQHESGIVNGNLSSIGRAQMLYRAALSMILSTQPHNIPDSSPGIALLTMALYTNLGHAADALQDAIAVEACRQGIEEVLDWMACSQPDKNNSSFHSLDSTEGEKDLDEHQFAEFFRRSLNSARKLQAKYAPAA